MSDIKKNNRKESKLQAIHDAYKIRTAVTILAEHNFYMTLSKVEDKVSKTIAGRTEADKKLIRNNMYNFYRRQINRITDKVIKNASDIAEHLAKANTIYPTYMSEFEERRLEMDRALECCNALQCELQYAAECLYSDKNKYTNLVLDIQKEFNAIKKLRQSDNRFLKEIKK